MNKTVEEISRKRGRPRTVFKGVTAKAKSNHDWHFGYWKPYYKDLQKEVAVRMFQLIDLHKKLATLQKNIQKTEKSRISHAKNMGVNREDSDKAFSVQELLKTIPEIMETMEITAKEHGIKLPTIEEK